MSGRRVDIEVERVAGESKLVVYLEGESVRVNYVSTLGERLFERLVVGREYWKVPYIASRICGVCSHAHFWASNLALENALGLEVNEATAMLRDVCNKLQITENHLVHLSLLALPDYAELPRNFLLKALATREVLKNTLELLCGRLSNPQPYVPGGFTFTITKWHLERALQRVKSTLPVVEELVEEVFNALKLPTARDPSPNYVSLNHWPRYSVPPGGPYRLTSNLGEFEVSPESYTEVFWETPRTNSSSKECTLRGAPFFVGARARALAKGYEGLEVSALEVLKSNPYSNLLAKALEVRYLLEDVRKTLENLVEKRFKKSTPARSAGRGIGVVEAPRGLLIHYYELSGDGVVKKANIITPTVMFTRHVEDSAEDLVKSLLYLGTPEVEIIKRVEMLVRAYDPCIPCAVHLVKVLKRGGSQ